MITRKTRLTSALLAVLMVVTMLAAYVLPVTAEVSSPYPYVRDMETLGRDYTDNWGIGSAEDWKAAIALNRNGETFDGKTLHFTADIDFDVDGSGETEKEEYIDALGIEDFAFMGNIHGHGYVIKNLFLDHDLTTEGKYAGLIGYANKSGMVIRDLGIASGTINIYGVPPQKENYSGAFMAYGSAVVFANCWNAATINADMGYVVESTELDMAPFGRGSGYTLVNCINTGDMISKGAVTNRTDAFLDWTTVATQVYNCVNMGQQLGSANYFFTFGSATDTDAEYKQFVGNIANIYVHNPYSKTNKSGINALLDINNFEIDSNEYYTGELASKLNENYVDTFDSLYGHKYFTMKNGELAMTDDPYEALYKLTISKKIGDYVVSEETEYYVAGETVPVEQYEGYVLDLSAEGTPMGAENETFRMPADNAVLSYVSDVPDWNIIKDLIEKYEDMVETGHAKALKDSAALTELLDKLKLSYAAKDTMTKEEAMARIARYVEDNANLDLSMRDDLVYPNYPLMRFYEKGLSKIWGIKTLEDWQKAIEIGVKEKETFAGITFHFLNDVDFNNVPVTPLCVDSGFAGNIDGHGYAIKNLLIDEDVATSTYTALIARTGAAGSVIRDLGIESGEIRLTGTGNISSGAKYVGLFMSYGGHAVTFANCWSNADINVDVEQYEIDCAPFGRNTNAVTIVNFIGNGDINVNVNGGQTARITGTLDWSSGNTIDYANIAYTGTLNPMEAKNNQSYVVGLATTSTFKSITKEQLNNIYGNASTGFSSKSDVNGWFPDASFTEEQVLSGELAWKLNDGYYDKYDGTYGRKYYTVKDGKLAFGTEAEQPVRINVKSGENATYFYGFPGDKLDLSALFSLGNPTFRVAETYAASIDSNGVLTIKSLPNGVELNVDVNFEGGLDYSALGAAIESYDGVADLDKYNSSKSNLSLPEKLAEVQSKSYTTQAEIDADVEILESYFYAIPITQYDSNSNAEFFAVASKADMVYLAGMFTKLTVNQTIIITANINMENTSVSLAGLKASIDGANHTISGLTLNNSSFLGDYAGKSIKDLTIKDSSMTHNASGHGFLISKVTTTTELSNVTMDNVTHTNIKDTTSGIQGLMIGQISGGTLKAKNIAVINSTMVRPTGSTYWNSGLVIGKTYKGKIEIDGVYVNNNTISGSATGSGTGVAFGELICDTTIKNVIVTNNTAETDGTIRGVFSSMLKEGSAGSNNPVDPEIHIENVITYNNDITYTNTSYDDCIGTAANEGKGTTIKNVYTDSASLLSATHASITVTNGNENASALIKSGEAAGVINAAGGSVAMKDGVPVFSKTGLAVKVTLDLLAGNDVVLYTDINGKLIGLTADLAAKFWTGYADIANAVFTEDTIVKQSDCPHEYDYATNNNGTHKVTCTVVNGCDDEYDEACSYTYSVSADGITHALKCDLCGYETSEACDLETEHVYGTYGADSKHAASCAVCGYVDETACSFTESKVAHTNIAKGYTEYTCGCGYSYKVEEAVKAHDFAATGVVVKAPTYTEAGTAKHACSVCDAYEYREIPALTGTGINVKVPESAMQGEEITVEIELANNAGNIAGMNLQVNYDEEVLSLTDIQNNEIFELEIKPNTATPGKVNLTYANAGNVDADKTEGKALTTLTFKVLDEAAFGKTEITANLVKSEKPGDTGAVDYDSNFVEVGDGAAVTEIMAYLWGDANMDGNVNVADAQVILQWRVGIDVAIDLTAADADRNGEVGIPDALMLLQYCNQLVEWDPNGTTVEPA